MDVFSEYSNINVGNETDVPEPVDVQFVVVAFIECLLAVLTIAGNIFVMLAFFTDEKIYSKTSNYYLLNLSASDLLVGVNMVINLSWWITDDWVLGETFCKAYIVMDYSAVFVSVITVIAISVDRLQLVNDPVSYHERQTDRQARKNVMLINACIWFFVVTFYGFMAFGWSKVTGKKLVDYNYHCDLETFENFFFNLAQTIFEFVIPLSVLIIVNVSVYISLWKRSNHLRSRSARNRKQEDSVPPSSISYHNEAMEDISDMDQTKSPSNKIMTCSTQKDHADWSKSCGKSMESLSGSFISLEPESLSLTKSSTEQENVGNSGLHLSRKKRRHNLENRKAAHRLSILVVIFAVTLMPYYITTLVSEFGGYFAISGLTWEIVNLMLWSNSTWNPFVYAVISPHFRRNFAKYLRCRM